jgi:photosynthetic reaction center cytochrome c subunit
MTVTGRTGRRMRRPYVSACMVAAVVALPSVSLAQQPTTPGRFPPDKFVNLQVFPKDTKPDVLIQAMKNFTRALGVRCQYCHIGKEGQPLAEFDFVSDANPHKNIARGQIRMTGEINARLQKDMPGAAEKGYQVTCYTCHRGAEHPVHSPDAAPKPPG